MFLARKISLAKWSKKGELEVGEIAADAVTADLRTQDNKLSFWRCGDGESKRLRWRSPQRGSASIKLMLFGWPPVSYAPTHSLGENP